LIDDGFQVNTLLVSDPKALQYIYQTKSYDYPKPPERLAFVELSNGNSVVAVDGIVSFLSTLAHCLLSLAPGDVHKRQRRVLLPAFGVSEARSFVPIFNKYASQVRRTVYE
jgi:cytochrome P450